MLIEIEEDTYNKVLKIVKLRNITLYNQIKDIKAIDSVNQIDTLTTARTIRTDRIKENIETALKELIQSNTKPSKYKVHKSTNIAYTTLAKYYDDILDELDR